MIQRGHDGGLMVDEMMRVRRRFDMSKTQELRDSDNCNAVNDQPRAVDVPNHTLFAAGDCCCIEWPKRESAHWFQMRLWSQARCVQQHESCATDCILSVPSALKPLCSRYFNIVMHFWIRVKHNIAVLMLCTEPWDSSQRSAWQTAWTSWDPGELSTSSFMPLDSSATR